VNIDLEVLIGWTALMSGGLALTFLSPTRLPHSPVAWWWITAIAALVAGASTFTVTLNHVGRPGYFVLTRDIIGSVLVAAILPIIIASINRRLVKTETIPFIRAALTLIILTFSLPIMLITILMVHCSSGDCL
jgi:hypothetical protein